MFELDYSSIHGKREEFDKTAASIREFLEIAFIEYEFVDRTVKHPDYPDHMFPTQMNFYCEYEGKSISILLGDFGAFVDESIVEVMVKYEDDVVRLHHSDIHRIFELIDNNMNVCENYYEIFEMDE